MKTFSFVLPVLGCVLMMLVMTRMMAARKAEPGPGDRAEELSALEAERARLRSQGDEGPGRDSE